MMPSASTNPPTTPPAAMIAKTPSRIAPTKTPNTMRKARMLTPSSRQMCGRSRAQASPAVTFSPSTSRLTTTVSSPVRTICASTVTTALTPVAANVPDIALKTSPTLASGSSSSDTSPARSDSAHQVSRNWSREDAMATTADRPSITRGCVRMLVIAPSSSSPMPSGRSGTTPGFGAGGGP